MAMLGKRQEDDGDEAKGGDAVRLNLDDLVCPTCGRNLAPWMSTCPDDGTPAVERSEAGLQGVPDIPAHLLEGLDGESTTTADATTPGITGTPWDGSAGDGRSLPGAQREEGDAG